MLTLALVSLLAALAPGVSEASARHSVASEQGLSPTGVEIDEQRSHHAHGASEFHCAVASGHCLIALVIPAVPQHDFDVQFSPRRAAPSRETREGIDLNRDPPPPRS